MRISLRIALGAGILAGALGAIAPANAHTTIVLAPGQMIGGGFIQGPAGPIEDPTSPGSAATDGTLVITSLDPTVTELSVRKCTNDGCTGFVQDNQGRDKTGTHAVAPGQNEIKITTGFGEHLGRYLVEANGALPAHGVFRVTGSD